MNPQDLSKVDIILNIKHYEYYNFHIFIHFQYKFFEEISRYIKEGKSIEHTILIDESIEGCNSFSVTWGKKLGNITLAKNICSIFISIYKKLKNENTDYINDSNYKNDFAFLNYWVNWKIQGEFYQNKPLSEFYDYIEGQGLIDINLDIDNPLIYDIEKNDLYKMKILYSLYENYSKLNDIIENKFDEYKQSLSTLSTACCPEYNKASYICNDDNKEKNPKFCEKLRTFNSKYDILYQKVFAKGPPFSENFIKLSECHNNKIITSAVTGTVVGLIPLLGVLYKVSELNIKL
ncbi:hypothetical protein PVNG_05666 [Plasmodium vivax North Korean]|uniref:Uncharacterized protein n=1 Tax=Plasmodium vivax North Korean TaxID=1035514 RepID=A0A0J9TTR4_PLAVI|nr:hypothetical protein PVNG_05666 [Plasmodium vivax North Korean]